MVRVGVLAAMASSLTTATVALAAPVSRVSSESVRGLHEAKDVGTSALVEMDKLCGFISPDEELQQDNAVRAVIFFNGIL